MNWPLLPKQVVMARLRQEERLMHAAVGSAAGSYKRVLLAPSCEVKNGDDRDFDPNWQPQTNPRPRAGTTAVPCQGPSKLPTAKTLELVGDRPEGGPFTLVSAGGTVRVRKLQLVCRAADSLRKLESAGHH